MLVRDPEEKRAPQAFFSTDTTLDRAEILALFVRRWQVEVTLAETRAHLGVETQRQWSDKAIARTTPVSFGLYSLIAVWACDLMTKSTVPYAAAWYRKSNPTFTDAIGAVLHALWVGDLYRHSPPGWERQKIPSERLARMAEALCFAATYEVEIRSRAFHLIRRVFFRRTGITSLENAISVVRAKTCFAQVFGALARAAAPLPPKRPSLSAHEAPSKVSWVQETRFNLAAGFC